MVASTTSTSTPINTFYQPAPDATDIPLNKVPQWTPDLFFKTEEWTVRRVCHAPAAADDLVDQTNLEKIATCEPATPQMLALLWKKYHFRFDVIAKNQAGDYYFLRSDINGLNANKTQCAVAQLPVSLTPTEAIVFQLWTGMGESNGFVRCRPSQATTGEYYYAFNDSNEEAYEIAREGLNNLIQALENPLSTDVYNSKHLPIDINPEKVYAIQETWRNKKITYWGIKLGLGGAGLFLTLNSGYLFQWGVRRYDQRHPLKSDNPKGSPNPNLNMAPINTGLACIALGAMGVAAYRLGRAALLSECPPLAVFSLALP